MKAANTITTESILAVELLPRGEYVRKIVAEGKIGTKTYIRGDYDRATKRYSLVDADDINREVFVKRGTELFCGFSY